MDLITWVWRVWVFKRWEMCVCCCMWRLFCPQYAVFIKDVLSIWVKKPVSHPQDQHASGCNTLSNQLISQSWTFDKYTQCVLGNSLLMLYTARCQSHSVWEINRGNRQNSPQVFARSNTIKGVLFFVIFVNEFKLFILGKKNDCNVRKLFYFLPHFYPNTTIIRECGLK